MNQTKKKGKISTESLIEIVYYTDPLCCWSWALEPQWKRLRYEFKDHIRWQYCMGGLIADWNGYNDPMNSVSRPAHMGPLWMEAETISGMPIKNRVWLDDAPFSSYPSCIAVKCSELQSREAAEVYLRRLRETVMLEGRNISRTEILLSVAEAVGHDYPKIFNAEQFKNDWIKQKGYEAFRTDLERTRYRSITRFPTLTFHKHNSKGVMITGYRPYSVLLDALFVIAPELRDKRNDIHPKEYESYWTRLTERELEEIGNNTTISNH